MTEIEGGGGDCVVGDVVIDEIRGDGGGVGVRVDGDGSVGSFGSMEGMIMTERSSNGDERDDPVMQSARGATML